MPIVNWNHLQAMAGRLNEQRKEGGAFCDVLLKVSGQLLPTHSCVLSACSPFFQGLICTDRPEPPHISNSNAPQEIELLMPPRSFPLSGHPSSSGNSDHPDDELGQQAALGLEAVIDLIDYMYTGTIELKQYSIELVVQLAEAFMLDDLQSLLRSYYADGSEWSGGGRSVSAAIAGQQESILSKLLTAKSGKTTAPRQSCPKRDQSKPSATFKTGRSSRGKKASPRKRPASSSSRLSVTESTATTSGKSTTKPQEPTTNVTLMVEKREGSEDSQFPFLALVKDEVVSRAGSFDDDFLVNAADDGGNNSESGGGPTHATSAGKKRDRHPPFRCSQCDFIAGPAPAELSSIRDHRRIHNDNRGLFVCMDCGLYTSRCSAMLSHLQKTSQDDDHMETECSLCGFVAESRNALVDQHMAKHEHRKPFFCQICERRCRDRSRLAEHMTMHAPDRPFSCDICSAKFKMKQCLRIHMWSHGKEKCYACDRCDFRTAYKYTLTMHSRVHDGGMFHCPREGCSYSSNSKHSLRSHVQTHAKLKPFICDVCGKKYSQACTLRRHAVSHNPDVRHLRCDRCPFVTVRRDRLVLHSRTAHGDADHADANDPDDSDT